MKKQLFQNPFVYGKVVGKGDFFDRIQEKEKLIKLLKGRNNILIVGDRRIGKTSLLLYCLSQLEEEKLEPFYINLDPITSMQSFIERYSSLFTQKRSLSVKAIELLKKGVKGFGLDVQIADDGSPQATLSWKGPGHVEMQTIPEILNLPQKLASKQNKHFLICFDEFQQAKDLGGTDIVAEMRSAFQQHDKITYVFMGSEAGILGQMFDSPKEKFFNSVRKFHLGPIPCDEFSDFIQKKFGERNIDVPKDVCKTIYEWGGQIPSHVQHLCAAIWEFLPENALTLSADWIDRTVTNEIDFNDGLYLQMWQTIGDPKDQMLLQRLARAKGLAVSGAQFCAPLSMNPATVTRRLAKTAGRTRGAIIHLRSTGYVFSDPFFEKWIEKKT